MSFVIGEDNVAFIKSRVATLKKEVFYSKKMKLSQDEEEMKSWVPLMIEGLAEMRKKEVFYLFK